MPLPGSRTRMPCYHPLHGYKAKHANASSGKRSWVKKIEHAVSPERLSIPCGRCIGCRLERSRQWALRCVHEAQLHEENSFITLTYDDEHLPPGGTLIKKEYQNFTKRLRKQISPCKIKYFHCGEYGEACRRCRLNQRQCKCSEYQPGPGRPHYHALLFGFDFPDKAYFKKSADGSKIYTSEILSKLWPAGFCTTGAVTFESAAYVARYCVKKINGEQAEAHYEAVDPVTGEISPRIPEYTTMSLKPEKKGEPGGIGVGWYKQFKDDVYPSDTVVLRGREMKPPKYYDRLLELEDPEARARIKEQREVEAKLREGDATMARLLVREKVKLAQIGSLKREL